MTDSRQEEYLSSLPPIMKRVRELGVEKRCDSMTLYMQKFLNCDPQKKNEELKKICRMPHEDSMSTDRMPSIPGVRKFCAVSQGRLLVNHTGGLIENSNLALHRFFCFPVIPGSAQKGIARSAAAADLREEDTERFVRVFGDLEKGGESRSAENATMNSGSVAFLQAVPADNEWKLVVDILTSHHNRDDQNPTPVPFPAVEAGAVFCFMIAPTARTREGDLEFAEKYLKIALAERGVGSKTAAGYGWFEIKEAESPEKWIESIAGRLPEEIDAAAGKEIAFQKLYVERMIKDRKRLIHKWQKKDNPNYGKLENMAQQCGMELPKE